MVRRRARRPPVRRSSLHLNPARPRLRCHRCSTAQTMAPGLFRKRRAPAAPAEPADPTPPASTATRPPPAIATAASTREPPRSYAQLADLADEIVASSWDSNLPLHLWLEGVRKLSTECVYALPSCTLYLQRADADSRAQERGLPQRGQLRRASVLFLPPSLAVPPLTSLLALADGVRQGRDGPQATQGGPAVPPPRLAYPNRRTARLGPTGALALLRLRLQGALAEPVQLTHRSDVHMHSMIPSPRQRMPRSRTTSSPARPRSTPPARPPFPPAPRPPPQPPRRTYPHTRPPSPSATPSRPPRPSTATAPDPRTVLHQRPAHTLAARACRRTSRRRRGRIGCVRRSAGRTRTRARPRRARRAGRRRRAFCPSRAQRTTRTSTRARRSDRGVSTSSCREGRGGASPSSARRSCGRRRSCRAGGRRRRGATSRRRSSRARQCHFRATTMGRRTTRARQGRCRCRRRSEARSSRRLGRERERTLRDGRRRLSRRRRSALLRRPTGQLRRRGPARSSSRAHGPLGRPPRPRRRRTRLGRQRILYFTHTLLSTYTPIPSHFRHRIPPRSARTHRRRPSLLRPFLLTSSRFSRPSRLSRPQHLLHPHTPLLQAPQPRRRRRRRPSRSSFPSTTASSARLRPRRPLRHRRRPLRLRHRPSAAGAAASARSGRALRRWRCGSRARSERDEELTDRVSSQSRSVRPYLARISARAARCASGRSCHWSALMLTPPRALLPQLATRPAFLFGPSSYPRASSRTSCTSSRRTTRRSTSRRAACCSGRRCARSSSFLLAAVRQALADETPASRRRTASSSCRTCWCRSRRARPTRAQRRTTRRRSRSRSSEAS